VRHDAWTSAPLPSNALLHAGASLPHSALNTSRWRKVCFIVTSQGAWNANCSGVTGTAAGVSTSHSLNGIQARNGALRYWKMCTCRTQNKFSRLLCHRQHKYWGIRWTASAARMRNVRPGRMRQLERPKCRWQTDRGGGGGAVMNVWATCRPWRQTAMCRQYTDWPSTAMLQFAGANRTRESISDSAASLQLLFAASDTACK
jgi:hypothetical protein